MYMFSTNLAELTLFWFCFDFRVFQIAVTGVGRVNSLRVIVLSGEGNLRRNDFGNSYLFQT